MSRPPLVRHPRALTLLAVAASAVAVFACSDDSGPLVPEPSEPATATQPDVPAELEALIDDLLAGGQSNAAMQRVRNIVRQYGRGQEAAALGQMYDLIEWLFERQDDGQLEDPNGAAPPTTEEAFSDLIGELYSTVGEPQPDIPPGALGPGGAAQIIDETGGTVTPEEPVVGVSVPPGAFDGPTLVTIAPLPNIPPLPTGLSQFLPFYDIDATSQPTIDVVIGICYLDDPPDTGGVPVGFPESQLRIAHPDPANSQIIEILTPAPVPSFLDCAQTPVPSLAPNTASLVPGLGWAERKLTGLVSRWLDARTGDAARRADATHSSTGASASSVASATSVAMAHRGLGGLTKSFSPFAIVDILSGGSIAVLTGDQQTGPNGVALPNPLIVEVLDALGNPIPGINVDFTIAGPYGPGVDGSLNPTTAVTNGQGQAQSSWTLSDGGEANRGLVSIPGFAAPAVPISACGTFVGQSLGAGVATLDAQTGDVTINGGDWRRPIGMGTAPFNFDWGDGTDDDSFFAASHTYSNTSQNYSVTVTATYCDGTTDQVTVPVDFIIP